MLALLTGGAGVVGRALCLELLSRGVHVRILTLPGDPMIRYLPNNVQVFYGDVTDYDSIRPAFSDVDVVYHLAAILLSTKEGEFDRINAGGTFNVVLACRDAHVRRLLYVSSISVTYPILTPYGQSKARGENFVVQSDVDWTIVRPTLVVGGGGGVEFNMFKNYVCKFPVYLLPGGGKALKRPVCAVDLVKGIAVAGLKDSAVGMTYALAGARTLSMAQMASAILKHEKKHHLMLPLPWWTSKCLAGLKNMIGGERVSAEQALAGFLYDAAPSIELAQRDLGYNPGSPF